MIHLFAVEPFLLLDFHMLRNSQCIRGLAPQYMAVLRFPSIHLSVFEELCAFDSSRLT